MLSVVIITLNEEAKIKDCLESVKWADEIIVVDSCSRDTTAEVAGEYTSKVHEREFTGFGEQKNYALSKAKGDWVLSIDADERVTPELQEEIVRTLANPRACGYYMRRKSYFANKWIKHCGWWPDYVLRLFRRDCGRFSDRLVHEATLAFIKTYFLKMGILDGWMGLVIAYSNAVGVFYRYVKCIEMKEQQK
jgi:glycosyltransferase involved in cell wall biosynthesis